MDWPQDWPQIGPRIGPRLAQEWLQTDWPEIGHRIDPRLTPGLAPDWPKIGSRQIGPRLARGLDPDDQISSSFWLTQNCQPAMERGNIAKYCTYKGGKQNMFFAVCSTF